MLWDIVIGLEVHCQLKTKSKIFSGSSTEYGQDVNSQASAIDLALPGILPVLNKKVIEFSILFGLAINAEINKKSIFARKNYFYPDLPKGYQISQFEEPIVKNGSLEILLDDYKTTKIVEITRAHLEEDAGKSVHNIFEENTGIDLNRAGTPLLEIVTEPIIYSAKEAVSYLKTLHNLVKYLDICDGNMQEGSFRCDVNLSLKPKGQKELGTRTEIKNLNSFKFVEKAINYEIFRQMDILENGGKIIQETRLYDSNKDETRSMRSKENAHDYRYFPDPDLLPVIISNEEIEKIAKNMPELPQEKYKKYLSLGLKFNDAYILSNSLEYANFFEETLKYANYPIQIANYIISDILGFLNKENMILSDLKITSKDLANLIIRIKDNTISTKSAKKIFDILCTKENENIQVDYLIEKLNLKQENNYELIKTILDNLISKNQKQFNDLKNGKKKLMGFFVGQIMKETKGKADPKQINQILNEKLKN